MMIDTLSQFTFILVCVVFFAVGIRNSLWSHGKEQNRFRKIVNRGLASHILLSGTLILSFGALIMFAAQSVPNSFAWTILSLAVQVLGLIAVLVARFASLDEPSTDQMLSESLLARRVNGRRIAGVLFILGGLVWAWNGAALITQF